MLESKAGFINSEKFFYLLITLTVVAILFTDPFLKYPYDMFTHLQWIDEQSNVTSPERKYIWHYVWAQIFNFFHIDRTHIFLRAQIIHYIQSISIFIMIFYTSKIFIKNLFIKISLNTLNYLGYWSALIWFTVFSTASEYHHQVWILWYSINYQITLPLTLLMAGLSISLIFDPSSNKNKMIKALSILLLTYIVLRIHAMEFLYFVMYMGILMMVYLDKLIVLWKKYIYFSLPLSLLFIYALAQFVDQIKTYAYRPSPIFNYLSLEKLPQLLEKIRSDGEMVMWHYSRASSTMNELIYLSLIAIALLLILAIYRHHKGYPAYINIRLAIFLFITSFFILIPIFKYTAGIASILTYTTISWRFYFSSLLFLAVPGFVFYLFSILKIKNILMLNVTIVIILFGIFFYSKYDIENQQNYYKNIISIKNAFSKEKMGFNLSRENIVAIGKKLKYYESLNTTQKPEYYYARDDIAFVLKFVYQKPVLYHRRGNINYVKSYSTHKKKKYYPILFETLKGFPEYKRYK